MTIKRTGGGAFDPADRHVYFAAGSSQVYPRHALLAVNDLMTTGQEKDLVRLLDSGHRVFLDSGVFWLTNRHARAHGTSMDEALALPPEDVDGFGELYARYTDLVTRYGDRLWGYTELDQGGRDNKRRTRARLEAEGLAPIPVYHPLNDGWDYFDELATSYDRICFGNIVQATKPVRLRLLHTLWERRRQYPHLWIHALGLTANEWCLPLPPDSCDSSAWVVPLRYNHVPTETSLMRAAGDLVPGFQYDRDDPDHPTRGITASCSMCTDAADAKNRVWTHARTDLERLIGQTTYPTRLPEEGPLAPAHP